MIRLCFESFTPLRDTYYFSRIGSKNGSISFSIDSMRTGQPSWRDKLNIYLNSRLPALFKLSIHPYSLSIGSLHNIH